MKTGINQVSKWVALWLFVGVIMVFVQILVGGVTRLTGSGLSITRWDIVTGTLPPLNEAQWDEAFSLYKETPQYKQINEGMELARFKFIFFWEYIHRLWARTMGFVFLLPFLFFVIRKYLRKETIRRLLIVVSLAATAALFGWIMVASGLISRPWVNAYKLTIHLGLGISLFIFLFYTWIAERGIMYFTISKAWKSALKVLIALAILQVCLGGVVSGMKAALNYPTWPTMNGEWVPSILGNTAYWNTNTLLLYDQSGFMPALVQFMHRILAYVILLYVVIFAVRWYTAMVKELRWMAYVLVGIIVVQVLLGILTLLGSQGSIPVLTGVLHQGLGIIFLTTLIYMNIRSRSN